MAVVSYICPHCSAKLVFDPKTQAWTCPFCSSSFEEDTFEEAREKSSYTETNGSGDETVLYSCPSCGAQMVTDTHTAATFCCYCHSPVVLSHQLQGEFKPSKLIPFKTTKEGATASFKKWCGSKWFLPSDFASPNHLQKLTGIYLPYWLMSCKASGNLYARAKNIRSWSDANFHYTETKNYAIERAGSMDFDYLPHDASSKAQDNVMASIEPFNFDELIDFSSPYLSGFLAEKYDVEKDQVYPTMRNRVEKAVDEVFKESIQFYNSLRIESSKVDLENIRFDYTLLPIWILTYLYNGKTYIFAMNGQTGKVFGELPVCRKKLTYLFFGLTLLIFIVLFVGGGLL